MIDCLFFRGEHFYSVQLMEPEDCNKTLEEQAADHAALNPGTTKVELMDRTILWEGVANKGMNQLDEPFANFDVTMVARLIEAGFKDGYDGVKVKYIDGSPMALSQALGGRMRKADDEIAELKEKGASNE